jgi:hypothetical protein
MYKKYTVYTMHILTSYSMLSTYVKDWRDFRNIFVKNIGAKISIWLKLHPFGQKNDNNICF